MKTPRHISSRRYPPAACWAAAALLAGVCLLAGTVLGADDAKTGKDAKKGAVMKPAKKADEKVVITGSLIPQKLKPNRIPATTSPVVIISRQDIERSGGSTLVQVLKKQGFGH